MKQLCSPTVDPGTQSPSVCFTPPWFPGILPLIPDGLCFISLCMCVCLCVHMYRCMSIRAWRTKAALGRHSSGANTFYILFFRFVFYFLSTAPLSTTHASLHDFSSLSLFPFLSSSPCLSFSFIHILAVYEPGLELFKDSGFNIFISSVVYLFEGFVRSECTCASKVITQKCNPEDSAIRRRSLWERKRSQGPSLS